MIGKASLHRAGGAAVRVCVLAAGVFVVLHVSVLRELPAPEPTLESLHSDEGIAARPEVGRSAAPARSVDAGESVPPSAAPIEDFKARLLAGDYGAAVDRYERLYVEVPTEDSAAFRKSLLNYASHLIQSGKPGDASDLLGKYLSIFYADVDALILCGRAHRDQHEKIEAIEAFQQAYQFEYRPAMRELIINQANNIIGELVQELQQQDRPGDIVALYEHLTQLQETVPGYFIGLANAYIQQRRYNDAIRTLDTVRHDVVVGAQARALIDKISALRAES